MKRHRLNRIHEFPISSELRMFTDDNLHQEILTALKQDIEQEGLPAEDVQLGKHFSGRFEPNGTQLKNPTGSGLYVQVIVDEQPIAVLTYVPEGWAYHHRFAPAGSMFRLLDWLRDEPGYHYNKYRGTECIR